MATFPRPTTNTTNEDDPIMKRVDLNKSEIGARPSGLPQGTAVKSNGLNIAHVGGSTGR